MKTVFKKLSLVRWNGKSTGELDLLPWSWASLFSLGSVLSPVVHEVMGMDGPWWSFQFQNFPDVSSRSFILIKLFQWLFSFTYQWICIVTSKVNSNQKIKAWGWLFFSRRNSEQKWEHPRGMWYWLSNVDLQDAGCGIVQSSTYSLKFQKKTSYHFNIRDK